MRSTAAALIAACFVILAGLGPTLAADAVEARVLFDNGTRIVVDYRFGDADFRGIAIDGQSWDELHLDGEPVFMERGAPALPHVNRSVVVPDDRRMKLRVLDSSYEEIFAAVAPSKGTLSRSVDPARVPYEFGPAYRVNAFYPGPLATLGQPYILRERRGVVVAINPFQYNPVTGVLRIYSHLQVEITADGPGRANVLDRGGSPQRASRAFDEMYGAHFLNETRSAFAEIVEEGEMLIIAHDPWIANLDPFVAHKDSIGIPTSIVGVSTIGNSTTAIQNHIQSVYDSSNLAYVLLVGDIAQVTSPNVLGGGSDPTYSLLAGGDSYPEIIVGRFSAGTAAELDTQIQRTINYETAPATEQDWFWKGVGIASAEGAGIGDEGESDKQHAGKIRDWLLGAGYTDVDEIYDPGASAGAVSASVNDGRGVINYTGHGWPQGWGTTGFDNGDVDALTNAGALPFIVSVACNNGEFESYGTCFAEAWMRATHDGQPAGAVGIYASSISQYWAEPMEGQDEFNLLLTDPSEPYHSLGALCFAGSSSMMDAYGQSGVDMFLTWILFGDPSLRVRGIAAPHGMAVDPVYIWTADGQAGGPFAHDSFQYTLSNLGDTPIDYSVDAMATWVDIDQAVGTIPPLGSVQVTATLLEATRSFDNGTYGTDIQFVNLTDHDGDTARAAGLTVGVPQLVQAWPLNAEPFWHGAGRWEFGTPLGQGGEQAGYPDPTTGATGEFVYGVNLEGDYPGMLTDPEYLVMAPFNLDQLSGTSIRFKRWLNTEAMPYASATIDVSSNGSPWVRIWENGEPILEDGWTEQSYSIGAVADRQTGVQVRWGYGVHDTGAVPCSGWNIDDIEVWAVPEGTARISLTMEPDDLGWTTPQGATTYDVIRGDLQTLIASDGDFELATEACVGQAVADTQLPFAEQPPSGTGWWILVRGRSTEGPMTYQALYGSQVGLRDEGIAASGVGCP